MRLFEIEEPDWLENILDNIKRDCKLFLHLSKGQLLYRGINNDIAFFTGTVRKDRNPKDSSKELTNIMNEFFNENGFTVNRNNSLFCVGDPRIAAGYGNTYAIFPIGNFNFAWGKEIDDAFSFFEESMNWLKLDDQRYNADYKQWKDVWESWDDYHTQLHIWRSECYEYNNATPEKRANMDNPYHMEPEEPKIKRYAEPAREDYYDGLNAERIKNHMKKNYIQNEGFVEAIESNNEIMIQCEEYYAIKRYLIVNRENNLFG